MNQTNKEILQIAIPSIISNITVPLLGLVDVTITGHLGNVAYIGAIAVGGMLFNMIYWIFGFLRMGTGGMTSQAYGSRNDNECRNILLRSLGISILLATILIMLQTLIVSIAFLFIDTSPEVKKYASEYFHICIWGAPAVLGLYSFTGWFLGMQNSRYPMYIAITQNVINIAASLFFVKEMGMKIEGVAYGTLIAQYAGLMMAIILGLKYTKRYTWNISAAHIFNRKSMSVFFKVNRDIFFRTLCIVAVTVFFTSSGATYGDTTLAVNTLLMQMFTIFSYIMDGFAYAGEALVGKHVGSRDNRLLRLTVRHLIYWGTGVALFFTLLYIIGGKDFLQLLTDDMNVINNSSQYYYWVLAIPFAGFMAFILDGICIGATATGIMLRSIFVASIAFFSTYYISDSTMGNHSLWMAFIVYLFVRGSVQAILTYRLIQSDFRAN
ncbi:MATE family efflux transporter [Bacteroides caecigallinarum]|uniref:MATE family efflux transporter n=1 Tax=Bacteroides caecigallinarum TaxID=1411144 RepID=UPI001F19E3C3|nr:MATE family efflux transporter [Bacteroides caecigallinarum]MCF2582539.1 MATE family efflux transporter [Bacteroides caecigallinarum]